MLRLLIQFLKRRDTLEELATNSYGVRRLLERGIELAMRALIVQAQYEPTWNKLRTADVILLRNME